MSKTSSIVPSPNGQPDQAPRHNKPVSPEVAAAMGGVLKTVNSAVLFMYPHAGAVMEWQRKVAAQQQRPIAPVAHMAVAAEAAPVQPRPEAAGGADVVSLDAMRAQRAAQAAQVTPETRKQPEGAERPGLTVAGAQQLVADAYRRAA